jgi:hypothetical protein
MKKRLIYIALFLAVGVLAFFLDYSGTSGKDCELHFHNDPSELVLTEHAKCRMRCRQIDRATLEDTYQHGELNCSKSEIRDGSFRYAVERRDAKGDIIRIILVEDQKIHRVITAIRLDKPDMCECD